MGNKSAAVYLIFMLGLLLLLTLGGWQWQRGMEKSAIEAILESTTDHHITIDRTPPNWSELAWRQVRLQGRWQQDNTFLLANRIHQGQLGYEAYTPFQLAGDQTILLINRGWIEQTATAATQLPQTDQPTPPSGRLHIPQKGFTLGAAYREQPGWPKVAQYFDAPALSAALGRELQPAVVALDRHHPAALTPIWQPRTTPAARHFAYAVQWWGLAITLTIFGLIWRRRARHNRHDRRAGHTPTPTQPTTERPQKP